MRENGDGVWDGDAPRPQADSLCYRYNNIPPVPLNNSHLQLNLGLWTTQDMAGEAWLRDFGDCRWQREVKQQSLSMPSIPGTVGDRDLGLSFLQPVAPIPGSLCTLAYSKAHTHSMRGLRSRILDPREGNGKVGPINPKPSSKEGKQDTTGISD